MLTDTGFSLHVAGLARTVSQHVLELLAAVGTSRQIDRPGPHQALWHAPPPGHPVTSAGADARKLSVALNQEVNLAWVVKVTEEYAAWSTTLIKEDLA
jgi:hypothetical protein